MPSLFWCLQSIRGGADTVCVRHGAQGVLDGASKATLENEFGTSNDDEVIIKMLEKGEVQESDVSLHPFLWPATAWLTLLPPGSGAPRTQERFNGPKNSSLKDATRRGVFL